MEHSYSYDTIITGSDQVATTSALVAAGENLPAYTPIGMVSASGKFKKFAPAASDGTETAVYITAFAVDATGADTPVQVYKAGTFNPDVLAWPDGATDVQKRTAFVGTPISLQTPAQL